MRSTLTFLGCGSAFSKKNFQSNMLLTIPYSTGYIVAPAAPGLPITEQVISQNLLIDCGRTAPEALATAGYQWSDIDAVYISHEHNDHAGSLEEMAFMRFFMSGGKGPPTLYGNKKMLSDLWDHTLKGGLEFCGKEFADLKTFFSPHGIEAGGSFEFQRCQFQLVESVHCKNDYGVMPSYGLFFETKSGPFKQRDPDRKVFITTDSQYQPLRLMPHYEAADVIFQDCETSPYKSGVHAHYKELCGLPEDIKFKMWLYHYQDGDLPDAKADGFQGFVTKGQVFEL